eukprot:6213689-Pleurochrysis_carterae.AAC.2
MLAWIPMRSLSRTYAAAPVAFRPESRSPSCSGPSNCTAAAEGADLSHCVSRIYVWAQVPHFKASVRQLSAEHSDSRLRQAIGAIQYRVRWSLQRRHCHARPTRSSCSA